MNTIQPLDYGAALRANLVTQEKPEMKQEEPLPMNVQRAQECIREECAALADFLCGKNAAYGNSAFEPLRVFSTACPLEQIRVRLDDKLSRLMNGHSYPGDNDKKDLLGYMLLERAVERYQQAENQCEPEPEPEPEPELESWNGFTIGQELVNKINGKTGIVHKFMVKENHIVLNSDGVLSNYFVWTLQQHWEPVEQHEDWNGVTVGQKLVNKHTGQIEMVQKIRDDLTVILSNSDPLALHQYSLYSMDDIKTHWVALKNET